MIERSYFFDSYAIIEIEKGNKNYSDYLSANIILSKLNLFEVYYCFLTNFGEKKANEFMDILEKSVLDLDNEVIINATKMKQALKKRKISMTDCIGYCTALKLGIKFLTGDIEFKNFYNVEYIK